MMDWISYATELMWKGALAATVPALLIGLWARFVPARPATRHALWLVALAWFAIAPFVPATPFGEALWRRLMPIQSHVELQNDHTSTATVLANRLPACDDDIATDGEDAPEPTPPRTGARTTAGLLRIPADVPARRDGDERRSKSWPEAISPGHEASVSSKPDGRDSGALRDAKTAAPVRESGSRLARAIGVLQGFWGRAQTIFTPAASLLGLLWLAGAVTILAARTLASWRFLRRLEIRRDCPAGILDLVADAARHIGLDRPPPIRLVADPISPMISFVFGPQLLLPEGLWSRLDDAGRKTIVYHELAHLARRDHWVRACDCLIGAVYWWHPVVWWVRRRLAEDAEHCCDAWVTWLLPAGRRVYARALLKTCEFISSGKMPTPALGIGVSTVRAKRFARRLTMVMTQPSRPRLSMSGVALVAALALAGWLATPAFSKPMSSQRTPSPPTASAMPAQPAQPAQPAPEIPPVPQVAATPLPGLFEAGTTFVQGLMAANEGPRARDRRDRDDDDGDDDLDARLDRLERKLEELTASSPRAPIAVFGVPLASQNGKTIAREYRLPEGKLEALLALMSRQDVPVPVQKSGDKIMVHATPAQHEIIEAFVRLIDPRDGGSPPVLRSRAAPALLVPGRGISPAVRAGSRAARPGQPALRTNRLAQPSREESERLQEQKERLEEQAERLREQADSLREKAESEVENHVKQEVRKQAEELAHQAREIARQVRETTRTMRDKERGAKTLERTLRNKRSDASKDDDDDDDGEELALAGGDSSGGADVYNTAYQLHMKGKYDQAIELFKKSAEMGQSKGASLYNVACGYSRKGDKDRAFEYLHKAWEAGYRDAEHMRQDDDLDNIRNDPRFAQIVGKPSQDNDKDDDDD